MASPRRCSNPGVACGSLAMRKAGVIRPEMRSNRPSPVSEKPKATVDPGAMRLTIAPRSEGHTSELQSLMRILYAVLCLQKHNKHVRHTVHLPTHSRHTPHDPH